MEFEEADLWKTEIQEDTECSECVSADDCKRLIVQMRKASLLYQQMCRIPQGELAMLLSINRLEKDGEVRVSRLGPMLQLSRPAVSRMLHILAKKDCIHMKNGEEDQRYVYVSLTEKGRELIHREVTNTYELLQRVQRRMGERCMNQYLRYAVAFQGILAEELAREGGRQPEKEDRADQNG